jgi:hypothetical protein
MGQSRQTSLREKDVKKERTRVPAYIRQLECLSCSNSRSFVLHAEATQRMISQAEAAMLPRNAVITCGRCGSSSLVRCWGDATPFATAGYVGRRRRRRSAAATGAAPAVDTAAAS